MKSRYLPIAAILVVLLGVALVGYVAKPAKSDTPTRVVLDNNGGRVIFTHAAHVEEYGLECADCHHDDIEDQEAPLACGTCHPPAFDADFRAEHQKAFSTEDACLRCHDDTPTVPLDDDNRPYVEDIPTRADAFHQQCMSCHEEYGGPFGEDSCYQCHAR